MRDHLLAHSNEEWASFLGVVRTCTVCGDDIEDVSEHSNCLWEASGSSESTSDSIECPHADCNDVSGSDSSLQWHIWKVHFDATPAKTTCPGCGERLEFGDVPKHVACIDEFDRSVSRLVPPLDRTCFICDITVYDHSVLHRHFYSNHLKRGKTCPGCGEQLDGAEQSEIVDHVLCIAQTTGTVPLTGIDQSWPCPSCSEQYSARSEYESHLEQEHLGELVDDPSCDICGEPIYNREDHIECLLSNQSHDSTLGLQTQIDPKQRVDTDQYFEELQEFVELERAAQRRQNRERYERLSIDELTGDGDAIPELIAVGSQYHPNFSTQLTFERPIPDGKSPDSMPDLIDEYGIYPREIVLVGSDHSDTALPVPGTVTFVNEQTIGIAFPEVHDDLKSAPLRNLTFDDRTYHVARLLNPTQFNAESDAVDDAREDTTIRKSLTGRRTLTGSPLSLPPEATGDLNEYQTNAVERALGSEPIVCIHGPPGTGKTRTLRHLIRLAVAQGKRVLATSHSNQAIDNLLVGTSTRAVPAPNTLHYVGTPAGYDRRLPPHLQRALEEDGSEADQAQARKYLDRPQELSIARIGFNTQSAVVGAEYSNAHPSAADLVAGTMGAIASASDLGDFDIVVVDEAGQAAQPPTFIATNQADSIVLAGDHLQLPPYVADETAKEEQMHVSLFEHLLNVYGDELAELLARQYRMNEQIAAFPNEHVYGGRVETAERNREWQVDDLKPIVGIDVVGEETSPPGSDSTQNAREAAVVADHVRLLSIAGLEPSDIGIITPYTAQIAEIESAIREKIGTQPGLKINTVDSFQGSEREAIIVSWVRSNDRNNSGFLAFPEEGKRRLNVAMTRARKRLVLVGDWNTLGTPSR